MTEIFDEDSTLPPTEHFGFTRVGDGESLAKDGYKALDLDRVTMDNLLYALFNAPRDGTGRLDDPTDEPSASVALGDGSLPGGTTFYYCIAYLDQWGLETAASPEIEVITNDPVDGPTAAGFSIATSGGSLVAGYYSYGISAITTAGEETTVDYQTDVRLDSGSANRITLDMPDLPAGATAFRVYRARPGQEELYYLDETASGTYIDDGDVTEDTSIVPPTFNDTNSSCSVEVTLAGGDVPEGVFAWRLYRTTESGIYDGYNLVHTVTEGVSELDSTPRDSWVDLGDGLLQGQPRGASATVGGGSALGFGGTDPDDPNSTLDPALLPRGTRSWDCYAHSSTLGAPVAQREYGEETLAPVQMDVYFSGTVPNTDAAGSMSGFELLDQNGHRLACGSVTDARHGTCFFWPGGTGRTLQAEVVADDAGDVTVVDDIDAYDGRAIEINTEDETVDFVLEGLDDQVYDFQVRLKIDDTDAGPADDLQIQVLDTDDDTVYLDMTIQVPPGPDYVLTDVADLQIPSDAVSPVVRITKLTATAATYNVDQLVFTAQGGTLSGLVSVRPTLVDPPGVAPLPALDFAGPRLRTDRRRVWAVEGVDTEVTVQLFAGVGVAWTAASDETWADPDASGTGDGTLTIEVDHSGLSTGTRNVATITVSAVGKADAVVEVVALEQPTAVGTQANISVRY